MITYAEVSKKYTQAHACMTDNLGTNFNFPLASDIQWSDRNTLARWLYGSSKEFLADFKQTVQDYFGKGNVLDTETALKVTELEALLYTTQERFVKSWGVMTMPQIVEGITA